MAGHPVAPAHTVAIDAEELARLRAAAADADRLAAEVERLRAALADERRRHVDLFERAPTFVAVLRGPTHVFDRVNAAYYQVIGHRDIVGRPVAEALPEVVAQGFVELLDAVLATGEPFVATALPVMVQRTAAGPLEEVHVDFVFAPVVEADGTRSGVVAVGSDVTERVLAERARARALAAADLERRRLAAVLEALPVGVLIVEAPAGQVTWSNAALARILGTPRHSAAVDAYSAEWTGWHVDDGRVTPRRYESREWPVARALLLGVVVIDEPIAMARADGSIVRVSVSAAPIRGRDGELVGAVAVVADVETQFRAIRAVEEAREAAEQANAAKSAFLAQMSHELRTPLNAIGGHVELIDLGIHGPVSDAQRSALGRVQNAQRHLLGLINDVLNFAKLQADSVAFDLRPVPLAEVVADVAAMMEPAVSAKGLHWHVAPAPPLVALADRDKLVQVLLNLLANAVKFTPVRRSDGTPGGVFLDVCTRRGQPDDVFIRVRDTGIGIPRERQQAIFDPFVQLRPATPGTNEGTGLGLAISRELARGMGGDVRVRSVPGHGATFTVSLRAAPIAAGGTDPARAG